LCVFRAKYDSRLGAERYEIVTGTWLRRPVRFTSGEPNHNDRSQAGDFRFLPVLPVLPVLAFTAAGRVAPGYASGDQV